MQCEVICSEYKKLLPTADVKSIDVSAWMLLWHLQAGSKQGYYMWFFPDGN